jgi:serine/threonine-protein kinase
LLAGGLAAGPSRSGVPETSPSPGAAPFVPPTIGELARRFPQLEILELVGCGGMGAVYKARQSGLDRLVAVKILPPQVGRDPSFAERFTREARALARLSHPNIVAVHDFGHSDGLYYFIMEFVDGTNLRQAIAAKALRPAEALAIVPQICDALQYAHDEGIVHRDIKPENILLDRKGRVKIADFGLSKLLGEDRPEATLTGTHQVMGTLRYMAPEQMKGTKAVDHRADIYSLGVVFYELLTGDVPMGRFDPPSHKVQIDVRLDEVVLRTLAEEPGKRYQRASEVKTDVEGISRTAAAAPPASPPPPRQSVPMQDTWDDAHDQVQAPATGLLVTGILQCAATGLFLLAVLAFFWLKIR